MSLIDQILSSNVSFQNVGLKSKGSNDYLSFDKKTGQWKIRTLSPFQQKCRDSLGMYKDTHAVTVATQLKKEISQMPSPKLQELDERMGHIPLVNKILPNAKTFEQRLCLIAEKLIQTENTAACIKRISDFVANEIQAGVLEDTIRETLLKHPKVLLNVKTELNSVSKNTFHLIELDKIVNEAYFYFEIKNIEKQIKNGKKLDETLIDHIEHLQQVQRDKKLNGLSEELMVKILQEHPVVQNKINRMGSSDDDTDETLIIDLEDNFKNKLSIN